MYYFSELALTLNAPENGTAPTDSRLRPDQRLMENGRWDEANAEKQRLEEKQRLSRKRREAEAARATEDGKAGLSNGDVPPSVSPAGPDPAVPHRDALRSLQTAVVRAEEGPGDAGAGARLQGGLLGEQGEAGLELVPGYFLSPARRTRRRSGSGGGMKARTPPRPSVCLNRVSPRLAVSAGRALP